MTAVMLAEEILEQLRLRDAICMCARPTVTSRLTELGYARVCTHCERFAEPSGINPPPDAPCPDVEGTTTDFTAYRTQRGLRRLGAELDGLQAALTGLLDQLEPQQSQPPRDQMRLVQSSDSESRV